MGMVEKRYDKFLDEGGMLGWLGRNVRPMLPQGSLTLPAIKEGLGKYLSSLSGTDEKGAAMSAIYTAQAIRELGITPQIVQNAAAQQPSYNVNRKLDELQARLEEIKKSEPNA